MEKLKLCEFQESEYISSMLIYFLCRDSLRLLSYRSRNLQMGSVLGYCASDSNEDYRRASRLNQKNAKLREELRKKVRLCGVKSNFEY